MLRQHSGLQQVVLTLALVFAAALAAPSSSAAARDPLAGLRAWAADTGTLVVRPSARAVEVRMRTLRRVVPRAAAELRQTPPRERGRALQHARLALDRHLAPLETRLRGAARDRFFLSYQAQLERLARLGRLPAAPTGRPLAAPDAPGAAPTAAAGLADSDLDGRPDATEADDDGDGVADASDRSDQGWGIPDGLQAREDADLDDDEDGVRDTNATTTLSARMPPAPFAARAAAAAPRRDGLCVFVTERIPQPRSARAARTWRARATTRGCDRPQATASRRSTKPARLGVRLHRPAIDARRLSIVVNASRRAVLEFAVRQSGKVKARSSKVTVRKGLRTVHARLSRKLAPGVYTLRIGVRVGKRRATTSMRVRVRKPAAQAPSVPVAPPAPELPPAGGPACDRDSDGDGVADCVEVRGFQFTYFEPTQQCVTQLNVVVCRQAVQRLATSDPNDYNTDHDTVLVEGQNLLYSLSDGQEWTLAASGGLADPGNVDSDTDGVSDVEELFRWGSRPNAVDTDGDSVEPGQTEPPNAQLFDLGERNSTAITVADTDGDGTSDLDEVMSGATSPVIADLPNIDVDQDDQSPGVLIQIGQEQEHTVTMESTTGDESTQKTHDERVSEVVREDKSTFAVGGGASCDVGAGGGNGSPSSEPVEGGGGGGGGVGRPPEVAPTPPTVPPPPPGAVPGPPPPPDMLRVPPVGGAPFDPGGFLYGDDPYLYALPPDLPPVQNPGGLAVGTGADRGPGALALSCSPKVSASFSKEWGTTRRKEHTTGFDKEDVRRTEQRYETELKTITDPTGSLAATFRVRNESETQSVVVRNLGVVARFICMPSADSDNGPGGCLEPDKTTTIPQPLVPTEDFPDGIQLPPLASRSVTLRADGINTGLLKDFLANPTNLSFTPENAELSVPGSQTPFPQTLANVIANTAAFTIDDGDDVRHYRVAAIVKRWWGRPAAKDAVPIRFREAVHAINRAAGQVPIVYDTSFDGTHVRRLKTLDGKTTTPPAADGKTPGLWAIIPNISPVDTLDRDLQDMRLIAGDEVAFAWLADVDGDGLWDREEDMLGTRDDAADSDNDGATGECRVGIVCPIGAPDVGDDLASDFFESHVGWTVTFPAAWRAAYPVYSSPTTCDGDADELPDGPGDGTGDAACPDAAPPPGRDEEDNNELALGTDPNVADTNGVDEDDLNDPDPLGPPAAPLTGPQTFADVATTFGGADSGSIGTEQPVTLCGTGETDPACDTSPGYYRVTWRMQVNAEPEPVTLGRWRILDTEIGADRTETLLASGLDSAEVIPGQQREFRLYFQAAQRLQAVRLVFDYFGDATNPSDFLAVNSATIEPVTRTTFVRAAAPDGQVADPQWAGTAVPGRALADSTLALPTAGAQSVVLDDAGGPPPEEPPEEPEEPPPPAADYAARTGGPGIVLPPGAFDARFGFSIQDKGAGEPVATAAVVAGSARPPVLTHTSGAFDATVGGYPLVQGRVLADDLYGVETTSHTHLLFKQRATTSVQFPVSVAVGAEPGLWLDHVVVEPTGDPRLRTGSVDQEDGTPLLPASGRWTGLGFSPQVLGETFMAAARPEDVLPPSPFAGNCEGLGGNACGVAEPFGAQYALLTTERDTKITGGISQLLPAGGLGAQWAAVVEPGVSGGCQGADYVVPAGAWTVGIDNPHSASLTPLAHAGPSTILPNPRSAIAEQASQGFASFGCFGRDEDDDGNIIVTDARPPQPLILRQVMLMRSPGPPISPDDALR